MEITRGRSMKEKIFNVLLFNQSRTIEISNLCIASDIVAIDLLLL